VRVALYTATLSAVRWDPLMKAHYQQLRQRGKLGKIALIAACGNCWELSTLGDVMNCGVRDMSWPETLLHKTVAEFGCAAKRRRLK